MKRFDDAPMKKEGYGPAQPTARTEVETCIAKRTKGEMRLAGIEEEQDHKAGCPNDRFEGKLMKRRGDFQEPGVAWVDAGESNFTLKKKPFAKQKAGKNMVSDYHEATVKNCLVLIPKPGITPVFEVFDLVANQQFDGFSKLLFK